MPVRTYGSQYHSAFNPTPDAPFASVNENSPALGAFQASATTLVVDLQDDTEHGFAANDVDRDLLFDIPDDFVPDTATSISVVIGYAERQFSPLGDFSFSGLVKTGAVKAAFDAQTGARLDQTLVEHTVAARTTDANGTTLTGATFKSSKWGIRSGSVGVPVNVGLNQMVLQVTYTNPVSGGGPGLSGKDPVGTTARLGVLRLDAGRLSAAIDDDNVQDGADGLYDWTRTTPLEGPPNAATGGWTQTDPEDA